MDERTKKWTGTMDKYLDKIRFNWDGLENTQANLGIDEV